MKPTPKNITDEQRFGITVSVATHLVLLLIAWLIYSTPQEEERVALMEVTLGEFQQAAPAQTSPEPAEEPEDTPEPEPEPEPEPTEPEPETPPETEPEAPVELPEQTEPAISDETIETPETEEPDPEVIPEPEPEPEPEVEPEPEPEEEPEPERRRNSLIGGDPEERSEEESTDDNTGRDEESAAPYSLEWEGDISRDPQTNPLPEYTVDVEAVITVRFAVRPDGTVGNVTPLRRTDPDLEAEVIRTIR
ncbi:MAG: energy transducer TonB [Cyclonatronaceae bacterium]